MKSINLLASFAVLSLLAATANAGTITYDYQTTLSLASGGDALGLNGATLLLQVDVSDTAVYIDRFTFPAVIMNDDATLTITGASNASNDGTFSLEQLAFYPTFAGLFNDPNGLATDPTLPVGGSLTLQINTDPTTTGAGEIVGNTVNVLDFAPATSQDVQLTGSDGSLYDQTNTTLSASDSISGVPEPATFGFLFVGLAGLGFAKRLKTR